MKKILIIPHHPIQPNLKMRLVEIAKQLSKGYDIFVLSWSIVEDRHSLYARTLFSLRDAFTKTKVYRNGLLKIVQFPVLRRPLCLVPLFNSFWLRRFAEKEKIDAVINGSYYMFNTRGKRAFRYIFDVADLPAAQTETPFEKFIYRQVRNELEKADAITVSSRGLKDYITKEFGKESFFIPNGADINKIRSLSPWEIARVRRRYGLIDKWAIGYIGNVGNWMNMDLLIKVFKEVKKNIKQASLLIAGYCPDYIRRRYASEDVVFTGAVNTDEIDAYFSAIDLGVMPSKKSRFQDLAFHLKAIEFTAARKFIVSTPREEMKLLNFPNVIFADEEENAWAAAIVKARQMRWDDRWDSLVNDYDWHKISQKFADIININ